MHFRYIFYTRMIFESVYCVSYWIFCFTFNNSFKVHSMKSFPIPSYLRSVYRKIRTRKSSVFGHFSLSGFHCGLLPYLEFYRKLIKSSRYVIIIRNDFFDYYLSFIFLLYFLFSIKVIFGRVVPLSVKIDLTVLQNVYLLYQLY